MMNLAMAGPQQGGNVVASITQPFLVVLQLPPVLLALMLARNTSAAVGLGPNQGHGGGQKLCLFIFMHTN